MMSTMSTMSILFIFEPSRPSPKGARTGNMPFQAALCREIRPAFP